MCVQTFLTKMSQRILRGVQRSQESSMEVSLDQEILGASKGWTWMGIICLKESKFESWGDCGVMVSLAGNH